MNNENNYIETNRASWNNRVDAHLKSEFYDMPGFLNGKNSLNEIELEFLKDIKGKSILHLQCHFGQDSISLARLGAHVTGVDLSDKAIQEAKRIAKETQTDVTFVCCNVYDLPLHLNKTFDYVFTSYGTISWLPDLDAWAKLISKYLKPNGTFLFAEFHPVVWMFDDAFATVGFDYFNTKAIIEHETGTYADRNAEVELQNICWNHSMSEVVNHLIKHNLEIRTINEYDYSPYNCFQNTIEYAPGKFRIKHLSHLIPMVYLIHAVKR